MRVYTVEFQAISWSTIVDVFDIAPATNKPIVLLGFEFSNAGIAADAGDAQEELVPFRVIRGFATVGSGGASATPRMVNAENDTAASFTARTMDTTVAVVGGGVTQDLHSSGFNVRVGYDKTYTEQQWVRCTAALTRIVVRLAAPTDAVLLSGTAWVGEDN